MGSELSRSDPRASHTVLCTHTHTHLSSDLSDNLLNIRTVCVCVRFVFVTQAIRIPPDSDSDSDPVLLWSGVGHNSFSIGIFTKKTLGCDVHYLTLMAVPHTHSHICQYIIRMAFPTSFIGSVWQRDAGLPCIVNL